MGSPSDTTHRIGATIIAVGLSGPVEVNPVQRQNGAVVKWLSGGSLGFVDNSGLSLAQGYVLGTTEAFAIKGPARFFLCATGSTAVAQIAVTYSSYAGSSGITL